MEGYLAKHIDSGVRRDDLRDLKAATYEKHRRAVKRICDAKAKRHEREIANCRWAEQNGAYIRDGHVCYRRSGSAYYKAQANRFVRRSKEALSGRSSYKKLFHQPTGQGLHFVSVGAKHASTGRIAPRGLNA